MAGRNEDLEEGTENAFKETVEDNELVQPLLSQAQQVFDYARQIECLKEEIYRYQRKKDEQEKYVLRLKEGIFTLEERMRIRNETCVGLEIELNDKKAKKAELEGILQWHKEELERLQILLYEREENIDELERELKGAGEKAKQIMKKKYKSRLSILTDERDTTIKQLKEERKIHRAKLEKTRKGCETKLRESKIESEEIKKSYRRKLVRSREGLKELARKGWRKAAYGAVTGILLAGGAALWHNSQSERVIGPARQAESTYGENEIKVSQDNNYQEVFAMDDRKIVDGYRRELEGLLRECLIDRSKKEMCSGDEIDERMEKIQREYPLAKISPLRGLYDKLSKLAIDKLDKVRNEDNS